MEETTHVSDGKDPVVGELWKCKETGMILRYISDVAGYGKFWTGQGKMARIVYRKLDKLKRLTFD